MLYLMVAMEPHEQPAGEGWLGEPAPAVPARLVAVVVILRPRA